MVSPERADMIAPRVSICIPAYRQPEFLRRALASIALQELVDIQVIVTDDSPDDAAEQVSHEFDGQFPLLYVRNNPALGSPGNWNAGLDRARAPLVSLLHHDDWFTTPTSLSRLVQLLDENPTAVLAFGASIHCEPDGNRYGSHIPTAEQVRALQNHPAYLFRQNIIGAPSAVLFRNGSGVRFDPALKWFVDMDFYIRLLATGDSSHDRIAWTTDELVCVMGNSDTRVTAECAANPQVEAFENIYLYDKLTKLGLAGPAERQIVIKRLHELGDPSAKVLAGYGVDLELAEPMAREARRGQYLRAFRHQLRRVRRKLIRQN